MLLNKNETLNKKDVNKIALQKIINMCNARAPPPTQTMQQVTDTWRGGLLVVPCNYEPEPDFNPTFFT